MTWFHRIKIGSLVLVWIFFTYLLMTYGDKELEHRQIAISPNENRSKFLSIEPRISLYITEN